jgi:O-antigen/teichoic acid export membrane protein
MENSEKSLLSRNKIKSAAVWTFGSNIGSQALRLLSNLIMTRLLAPELFGIMAAANLVLAAVVLLSDIGLSQSVVRSKNATEQSYINTTWTLQVLRGLVITLFVVLLSYAFGSSFMLQLAEGTAYGNPLFSYALLGVALSALAGAFQSPHIFFLDRRLQIRRKVVIEISSQVISIILGILYAMYIAQDINALLVAMISSIVVRVILSHIAIEGSQSFEINKTFLMEIINYGKWIIISSVLGFFLVNGNRLILSFYVDEKTLGIFSIALFILMAFSQSIGKIFSSVFFPVLSNAVRVNPDETEKIYEKIKKKVDPIVFFISSFFYFSGKAIIDLLYDERYVEAGTILSILSIGLISIAGRVTAQLYFAVGNSKAASSMALTNTIILYTVVPTTLYFGDFYDGIWAIALVSVARLFVSYIFEYMYYKKIFFNYGLILLSVVAGTLAGLAASKVLTILEGLL